MLSIKNLFNAIFIGIFSIVFTFSYSPIATAKEVTIPPSGGMSAMKNLQTDTRLYCFLQYKNGNSITKKDETRLQPKMEFPEPLIGIHNIEDHPKLASAYKDFQKGLSVNFKEEMLKETVAPVADKETLPKDIEEKSPTISISMKNNFFEIRSDTEITNAKIIVTITDGNGAIIETLNKPPYQWKTEGKTKGNYTATAKVEFGDKITTTSMSIVVTEKSINKSAVATNTSPWILLAGNITLTIMLILIIRFLIIPDIRKVKLAKMAIKT